MAEGYCLLPSVFTSAYVDRVLAWVACRALGETDLNPVSGVSKLTQVSQLTTCP